MFKSSKGDPRKFALKRMEQANHKYSKSYCIQCDTLIIEFSWTEAFFSLFKLYEVASKDQCPRNNINFQFSLRLIYEAGPHHRGAERGTTPPWKGPASNPPPPQLCSQVVPFHGREQPVFLNSPGEVLKGCLPLKNPPGEESEHPQQPPFACPV